MKNKKAFELQTLIVSFVVIALCEIYFLLDVSADFLHVDIAAPGLDNDVIELISAVTLAFALVVIGRQTKRLLREHRDARASIQVASGELLAVIDAKFDVWKLTPARGSATG